MDERSSCLKKRTMIERFRRTEVQRGGRGKEKKPQVCPFGKKKE